MPRGGTPRLGTAQAEAPGAEVAERKQAGASRLGLRGGGPTLPPHGGGVGGLPAQGGVLER